MFKNALIGGGDPEGKGFFRSLSGTWSVPLQQAVQIKTIDCGFVPRVVLGNARPQSLTTRKGAVVWGENGTNIQTSMMVDSGDTSYMRLNFSVAVAGNQLTMTVDASGTIGQNVVLDFCVTGSLQD